jgi:hypothetical protein
MFNFLTKNKMKKLLLFAAFVLLSAAAHAQASGTLPNGIKMYPGNATGADLIRLEIDLGAICTPAGKSPLAGKDSIYMHSGCNGWSNQVTWDGVPAGGAKTNTKLYKGANGKMFIEFVPNAYYGTSVTELDFVFNQGGVAATAWDAEGKATDAAGACADFKILIFAAGTQDLNTNLLSVRTYPNPFAGTTKIDYALNARQEVSAKIYSALGTEVATLVDGVQEAGSQQLNWNGTNNAGVQMPKGNYVLRIKSGDVVSTHKLIMF